MGTNTHIEWTNIIPERTGATWNPMKATNTQTGKSGYICLPHGPGCLHCYAASINRFHSNGNGLEFSYEGLQNAKTYISGMDTENNGQTSVHWPIRSKISQGIFAASMTDWLGEFYTAGQLNAVAFTMLLAQHHVFLTLTKREDRLLNWLKSMTAVDVPGLQTTMQDRYYNEALMVANSNFRKYTQIHPSRWFLFMRNPMMQVSVPWPPRNVIFGVTIVNQNEAKKKREALIEIRKLFPEISLMVSYEPALEPVDWELLGYQNIINWLIVGGESGEPWDEPRPLPALVIPHTIAFGEKYKLPIFVKQVGAVRAQEMGLKDTLKGTDVPENWCVRQFPSMKDRYFPWPKR